MDSADFPVKEDIMKEDLNEDYTWNSLITNIGDGIYTGTFDFKEITNGETITGGNYAGYVAAWNFVAATLGVYVAFLLLRA